MPQRQHGDLRVVVLKIYDAKVEPPLCIAAPRLAAVYDLDAPGWVVDLYRAILIEAASPQDLYGVPG